MDVDQRGWEGRGIDGVSKDGPAGGGVGGESTRGKSQQSGPHEVMEGRWTRPLPATQEDLSVASTASTTTRHYTVAVRHHLLYQTFINVEQSLQRNLSLSLFLFKNNYGIR